MPEHMHFTFRDGQAEFNPWVLTRKRIPDGRAVEGNNYRKAIRETDTLDRATGSGMTGGL